MIRRTDSREKPCLPSLAVEILYSELQAAPSMLIEFPFVGRGSSLDGGLSELCDAAAEVTRGAPVRVMNCVGSAVIRRLCAGSEGEAKTLSNTRPETKRGLLTVHKPGVAACCFPAPT